MTRLLLDINVILDLLAERQPWVEESAAVMALLERPDVQGVVAAHSVTTLFYLVAKTLGRARSTAVLLDLLDHVEVVPLDRELILRALSLGWDDFEDAVQGVSAQDARVDYLVTRNPRDFASLPTHVATPGELLAELSREA